MRFTVSATLKCHFFVKICNKILLRLLLEKIDPSIASIKSGGTSSKIDISGAESSRSVSVPPSHVSDVALSEMSEKPKACVLSAVFNTIVIVYVFRVNPVYFVIVSMAKFLF